VHQTHFEKFRHKKKAPLWKDEIMFLKKLLLTIFASASLINTSLAQNAPIDPTEHLAIVSSTTYNEISLTSIEQQTEPTENFLLLTTSPAINQSSEFLRAPDNKSFANVRVFGTTETLNLQVDGSTTIGNNLTVRNNATVVGNLVVDGVISSSGSIRGPGLSLPNSIPVFADATGASLVDTPVLIDTAGNITDIQNITVNNTVATQDLLSSGTLFISALANINSPNAVVTWPTTVGTAGTFLGSDGAGNLVYSTPTGAGNVSAAANFTTNNRVLLTDTPSGTKNVKESANVVIDGSDNISGVATLGATTINATTLNATTVNAPTLNGTANNVANVGSQTAADVAQATINTLNATNAGTPNTIVLRDGVGDGGFSAGTIVATEFSGPLTGNANSATFATTAGSAGSFSGLLGGDVTGPQGATIVNKIGNNAMSSGTIISGINTVNAATSTPGTPGTLVIREPVSGNFSAGTITAAQFNGPLVGNVNGTVTGSLIGNATSATLSDTAQWFSAELNGDVKGSQLSNYVNTIVGTPAALVVAGAALANAATENSNAGTIVKRDASKNFATNMITLDGIVSHPKDATTKAYVDAAVKAGLIPKTPVLVTSIDTDTPTAGLTTPIDGVTLSPGDRVLLTQQTYQIDNGIWLAQSLDWERPIDFLLGNTAGGAYVLTSSGITLAGSGWLCSTPLAIIGTDTVTFEQFSSPSRTTGANVGTGVGELWRDTTGVTLNFKTLANGPYMNITNGADTLTLAVTATSEPTANTIVARNNLGSFYANNITASLTGHASEDVLKSGDTMTGDLVLSNNKILYLNEAGPSSIGIKAPTTVPTSYTFSLPMQTPTTGQYLQVLNGGVSATLTWTAADAPPGATKTIYVAKNGSPTNDGSLSAPLDSIKAAVSMANGVASTNNPVTISIGAGIFTEDNFTGGPLTITSDGISIVGSALAGTIIQPQSPTDNLFTVTVANTEFSNLSLETPPFTSTKSAINVDTSSYGRIRFINIACTSFNKGFEIDNNGPIPATIFFENVQCAGNTTSIELNNAVGIISGSVFRGPLFGPAANTGVTVNSSQGQAYIFGSYFSLFNTALSATDSAFLRVLSCNIESSINGVVTTNGSKTQLLGINFLLNTAPSTNVSSSDAATSMLIEGCLFDCKDTSNNPQGTAIKATNNASISINASTIEQAAVGIHSETNGTVVRANGVSIIETTTSIRQRDLSTVQFVGGSLNITKLDISNSANVNFAGFNANNMTGETRLAIGKIKDDPSVLYEILNGQPTLPTLSYEPNYYGYKGAVYANTNNNPTFNATQSDQNNARYFVVTGKNYKEAGISLISDSDNIGDAANVRGWSIIKTGTTAELAFTFTNNDPGAGTPNCGPYNVMQLNGFSNQVEFPIATSGNMPTNQTAKLVWGGEPNTNLYRPTNTPNTLRTDANFIVGGAFSSGSTLMSTLTLNAGMFSNPSLQFAGSTNTGLSAQFPNRLSFDTNGFERMSIDSTGTVAINQFTTDGVVHNNATGKLSSSLIVNADVAAGAAIVDTKLATISSAEKVLDSATTATSFNIADKIVKRDSSNNFSAGMITASLTGMVTGTASFNVLKVGDTMTGTLTLPAGSAGSPSLQFAGSTNTGLSAPTLNTLLLSTNGTEQMSINATGTVTINQLSGTAGIVHNYADGALSSSLIVNADVSPSAAITDNKLAVISAAGKVLDSATTATSFNIFNTIVKRDTAGNFSAGMITSSLTGMVTGTASFNVLKIGDTMTGRLTLPPGTATAPSLNFTGGTTTGISMPSADYLSFDTAGIERMSILPTGTIVANAGFVFANTMAQGAIQIETGTPINVNNNTSILIVNRTANTTINFPSPTMQGQLFTIVIGNNSAINFTATNNFTAPATAIINPITNFNSTNTYQAVRARCAATYIYYGTIWYLCGRG